MKFRLISLSLLLIAVFSCTVNYTTKQGTQPVDAKAIYIPTVYNQIGAGPSSLSQDFSELLREYFQRNTKLEVSKEPVFGELSLEGYITGYRVTPVSPASGSDGLELAAQNRLTMTVKFKYVNPFNKKDDFNESFSYFKDYEGSETLSNVEDELLEEIYEQLIIKVFNKSFDNW